MFINWCHLAVSAIALVGRSLGEDLLATDGLRIQSCPPSCLAIALCDGGSLGDGGNNSIEFGLSLQNLKGVVFDLFRLKVNKLFQVESFT